MAMVTAKATATTAASTTVMAVGLARTVGMATATVIT